MSLVQFQVLSFFLCLTWSNGQPIGGLADYTTSHVKADGSIVKISTFSGENALKTIDFINNDQRVLWQQSLWPWQNQFTNNYYRQPYYYNNYNYNYGNNYAQVPLTGSLWNYFLNDWHLRSFPMPLVPSASSYYNYGQQPPQYYLPNPTLVPGQGQQYIPGQFPPNSGNNVVSSVVSNEATVGNPSGNFVSSIVSQNGNQAEPTIVTYTGNSPNFVSSVVSNNQAPLYPAPPAGYIPSPAGIQPPAEAEEEKENDNEVEVEKDD